MADADALKRRVVEQMLVGVATRPYARSLASQPPTVTSRGTRKIDVSRRFVAKTRAQFEAWQAISLEGLDLVRLLLDGVYVWEHCLIVELGIAADGKKHVLGLWEGSTENTTLCQSLPANLQSRGLRTDPRLLVMLDGSKALRKAVRNTFGDAPLVQRLEADHPSAAESAREGLDETLRVLGVDLSEAPRRSMVTTTAAESLISRTGQVKRNVKLARRTEDYSVGRRRCT